MKWLKNMLYRYKDETPNKCSMVEMTEFELSISNKILVRTDNLVKDLLEQIDDQRQTIEQKEKEIKRLKNQIKLHSTSVVTKEIDDEKTIRLLG